MAAESRREPVAGPALEAPRSCLGSRRRDLLAAALATVLVLGTSPFLAVYHRVTVMELRLVRLEPDGRRIPMPTPAWGRGKGGRPAAWPSAPRAALGTVERRMQRLIREDPAMAAAAPGTRVELTVRYSENGTGLDRAAHYMYWVPAGAAR
jgi:hypothetical protein